MADPVLVDCPKDVWTKVATAVLAGTVKIIGLKPRQYYETYRLTGTAAPVQADPNHAAFDGYAFDRLLGISDSGGIDVYILPMGEAGKVRVDK